MYAIIKSGGRQYKVNEGDVINVDLLNAEDGSTITIDSVMMIGGETQKLGTPLVAGASVEAKVIGMVKGQKVTGMYFRRRKNSMKRIGHRQQYTRIQITKIAS